MEAFKIFVVDTLYRVTVYCFEGLDCKTVFETFHGHPQYLEK